MIYSNPRMEAVIHDWPHGNHKTVATFRVETDLKRGQRATRFTINPKTGKANAPKLLTYARRVRIVDGDDGKTYIIQLTDYGHISVMHGDMKYQAEDAIFSDNPRYAEIRAMFE